MVAPLSPVAVGDDWFFWDADLDGTCNKPRLFWGNEPSSVDEVSDSLEVFFAFWGFSRRSRDISWIGADSRIDGARQGSACGQMGQHYRSLVEPIAKCQVQMISVRANGERGASCARCSQI